MPRVPRVRTGRSDVGANAVPRVQSTFGGLTQQSVGNMAQTVAQVGEKMAEMRVNQEETKYIHRKRIDDEAEYFDRLRKHRQEFGDKDLDIHAQNIANDITSRSLEDAPHGRAQTKYKQIAEGFFGRQVLRAKEQKFVTAANEMKEVRQETTNKASSLVADNPSFLDLQTKIGEFDESRVNFQKAGGIFPEEMNNYKEREQKQLVNSYLTGRYLGTGSNDNPEVGIRMLESKADFFRETIGEEKRLDWLDKMRRKAKSNRSANSGHLTDLANIMIRDGSANGVSTESIQNFNQLVSVFEPEKQRALKTRLALGSTAAEYRERLLKDPEDPINIDELIKNNFNEVGVELKGPAADAIKSLARDSIVQEQTKITQIIRSKEPEKVFKYDRDMSARINQSVVQPELQPRVAEEMQAKYESLGVAKQNRTYLTPEMAAVWGDQLEGASDREAASVLTKMEGTFGENFYRAVSDLKLKGKINDSVYAMAFAPNTSRIELVQAMRNLDNSEKRVIEANPKLTKADVLAAVSEKLENVDRIMLQGDPRSGTAELMSGYNDLIYATTLDMARKKGGTASRSDIRDYAAMAVKKVFHDNWHVVDEQFIMPKTTEVNGKLYQTNRDEVVKLVDSMESVEDVRKLGFEFKVPGSYNSQVERDARANEMLANKVLKPNRSNPHLLDVFYPKGNTIVPFYDEYGNAMQIDTTTGRFTTQTMVGEPGSLNRVDVGTLRQEISVAKPIAKKGEKQAPKEKITLDDILKRNAEYRKQGLM